MSHVEADVSDPLPDTTPGGLRGRFKQDDWVALPAPGTPERAVIGSRRIFYRQVRPADNGEAFRRAARVEGIDVYEAGMTATAMTRSSREKYDTLTASGFAPAGRWGMWPTWRSAAPPARPSTSTAACR